VAVTRTPGITTARRIPWWEPQPTGGEEARVLAVLRSNYLNDGDVTSEFERRIEGLFGASHAVATTSGTTAIFLALAAAGVGQGDEAIVPDVTFIATPNAVRLAGATPVLVDVDPVTLNIDPERVGRAITTRTKALVPVHVSGRSADMSSILAIAKAHGLAVIEDAAEALLSRPRGTQLGTIGNAGCLSFSPNKTITTGQGGMVLTQDAEFAGRLRALKDQGRLARGTGGNDLHPTLGFNFKLTNVQAAIGLAQAESIEPRVARLKQIYCLYRDGLADVNQVRLLPFDVDHGESPQWVDAIVERRDALVAYLLRENIHCRPFWWPIHTQRPYLQPDADFPHSSRLMPQAVWLPSALSLSDDDVGTVCERIREFYKGKSA
jgi:perosamine synthetase